MIKLHELAWCGALDALRHEPVRPKVRCGRHVRLIAQCLGIFVNDAAELWENHGAGYIYTNDGVYPFSMNSFARIGAHSERIVGIRCDGSYVVHKRRTPEVRTMVEKYDYHSEPSHGEFGTRWHEMSELNRMFRDGMGERIRKRCGVKGTKTMNDYTQRVHKKRTEVY